MKEIDRSKLLIYRILFRRTGIHFFEKMLERAIQRGDDACRGVHITNSSAASWLPRGLPRRPGLFAALLAAGQFSSETD